MPIARLLTISASLAALATASMVSAQAGGDAGAMTSTGAQVDPAAVSTTGLPGPGVVTNLRDALTRAYGSDPSLLSSQASQRAAEQRHAQARGALGPSVELEGRYGYNDFIQRLPPQTDIFGRTTLPDQRTTGWTGTATAAITQPIFTSGRLSANVQSAREDASFARQNVRFTENRMFQQAITSYVAVRRDRALYAIAQDNLALLDRQFSESDQRFKVREITRADLDQVVTRVEQGRASVAQAQGGLEISLGQFLAEVGSFAGELEAPPELPNMPETLDQAYGLAEAQSPSLLASRARERASRAAVKGAYAALGPNVSLQGSALTGGSGISVFQGNVHSQVLRAEVVANLPLYQSGQRIARIRETQSTNEADWRTIDATLRDIHVQVNTAWSQLMSTRAALGYLNSSVAAAQRAYDGSTVQLRAGARTTLDVLDLARDLLNARSSYVRAQADEYIARVNLLAAIGRLEIRDLYPDITPYDAEKYDRRARRAGTPITTDIVYGADSLLIGSTKGDRAVRDNAATTPQKSTLPTVAAPKPGP